LPRGKIRTSDRQWRAGSPSGARTACAAVRRRRMGVRSQCRGVSGSEPKFESSRPDQSVQGSTPQRCSLSLVTRDQRGLVAYRSSAELAMNRPLRHVESSADELFPVVPRSRVVIRRWDLHDHGFKEASATIDERHATKRPARSFHCRREAASRSGRPCIVNPPGGNDRPAISASVRPVRRRLLRFGCGGYPWTGIPPPSRCRGAADLRSGTDLARRVLRSIKTLMQC
jgi:hypothetical protein